MIELHELIQKETGKDGLLHNADVDDSITKVIVPSRLDDLPDLSRP